MEAFFRQLNLHALDGYRYERALSGGQAASIAIYARGDGPTPLTDPPARVAVKFLISPRRERELEVFRREAETLLMLRRLGKSPTIVKALGNVVSVGDLPIHYFFMEYVEGETVTDVLLRDPPPWDAHKALDLLRRITTALIPAAANAQIHRDLHPGNIMISGPAARIAHTIIDEDPGVRILDFGVGRNWLADQRENWHEDRFRHPGAVSSWSPELLRDPSAVDSKHDVWALANLLYRLLTGEYAFYAESFSEYYERVLGGHFNEEALADQPAHIRRLLAAMFALEPRRRISLGGLLKICSDICDHDLEAWLERHPALAELYFVVEGNIWTCPLCAATSNPTNDSRCRSCGRYVEDFRLPFPGRRARPDLG